MAFNIKDFLNEESKAELKEDFKVEMISAYRLHQSKKNFYSIEQSELNKLKETIELVGVQENLIVKEIKEGEHKGDYEIIAGHRRHRATLELLEEGKGSEMLPCRVNRSKDDILQDLVLIFTNSTQRERSDYEKMQEAQTVKQLLTEYEKTHELPGRKREIVASILNTSTSVIGRLDNINNNLSPEFKEAYKEEKIATYTANELAGISREGQKELFQEYKETGKMDLKTAKEAKKAEKEQRKQITEPVLEDTTDREHLLLNGRINKNKEYNGVKIDLYMAAVKGYCKGWNFESWERGEKLSQLEDTGEAFGFEYKEKDGLCYVGEEWFYTEYEDNQYRIKLGDVIDLIDAMLVVGELVPVIVDIGYWSKKAAEELKQYADYVTNEELAAVQEIVLKARERSEKDRR